MIPARTFILLLVFGLLYVAVGLAGLEVDRYLPGQLTVFWVPAGIGLYMLLRFGWLALAVVFVAAFIIHPWEFFRVLSDTLQPALGYLFLQRVEYDRMGHDIRAYLRFLFWGAILPPMLTNGIQGLDILADGIGIALFVPAAWAVQSIRWKEVDLKAWRDAIALALIYVVILAIMFTNREIRPVGVLFPLTALALRLRVPGATVGMVVTAYIVVVGTALGYGALAQLQPETAYVNMVSFILAVGLPIHLIAISREASRRAHEDLEIRVEERTHQLRESEQLLAEMNSAKDRLMSIIAHDLRSPLSGIVGVSSFLEQDARLGNYADIEQHAGLVHRSARQTLDLLHNLLDWSAAQSGGLRFEPIQTDLAQLVHEALAPATDAAESKRVRFSISIPPDLTVRVDRHLFSTILRNLASNAIKFTRAGGQVDVRAEGVPGGGFRLWVKDSGIGMPREIREALFKAGETRTTPGTDGEKGSGLGLVLCAEFVRQHEATLQVSSEPGVGTTFELVFPV